MDLIDNSARCPQRSSHHHKLFYDCATPKNQRGASEKGSLTLALALFEQISPYKLPIPTALPRLKGSLQHRELRSLLHNLGCLLAGQLRHQGLGLVR